MGITRKIFKYTRRLNTAGFWAGFGIGLAYFSYVFWWLWSLYPLDAFNVESGFIANIIIAIIFTLCIAVTAVFWGVCGFFTEKFSKKMSSSLMPLVVAGTFTLTEFFRSIFFSIFWYGDGGVIGPYWPLGNLAYWFADFDFIAQTASFWGIYGITFLLSYLVAIIVFLLKPGRNKKLLGQLIFILTMVFGLTTFDKYKNYSATEQLPISVAVIQTNISPTGLWDQIEILDDFKKKLQLTEEAAKTIEEGIIIFPEGANFSKTLSKFLDTDSTKQYFNNLSEKELLIIDNFKATTDNLNLTSNSVFISSKNGVIGFYAKQLLTMIGEFLPYILKLPVSLVNPDFIGWFSAYGQIAIGSDSDVISYRNHNIKILVCSDLLYPPKAGIGNPDFIITTGNYSISKGSSVAKKQILSVARFRAMENGKYMVLAANSDQSYIINPLGKVEKTTNPESYELLTGTIIPNKNRTWYNYVGDWPIILLSAAIFGLSIRKISDDQAS